MTLEKIKDFPLSKSSTVYSNRVIGGVCVDKGPGCQTACEGENVSNCPKNGKRTQARY
jgi:hypothetical protein